MALESDTSWQLATVVMRYQQGQTSVRTNSFGDLVSSDEPEALPSSKDSQQFRDVEAIG